MAGGRHDFGTLLPTRERKQWEFALRNEYFEYYNDERDEWDAESVYTAEEAHGKANSYQRYRLFTFSNFLTKPKTISTFQVNVEDILGDARPGSVLLIIGGKGGDYPAIYERMARLAEAAGFGRRNSAVVTVRADAQLAGRLDEEIRWFYGHLKKLANDLPVEEPIVASLRDELESGERLRFKSSKMLAYRK